MEVIVRHSPSFAVARLRLAAGEQVKVESGAMMATSADVAIEAKMQGGVMKSLKRAALGGESLSSARTPRPRAAASSTSPPICPVTSSCSRRRPTARCS